MTHTNSNVVAILNHVDSLNLGDASLLFMTITIIKKALSPNRIFVLSFDTDNDRNIKDLLKDETVEFILSPARTSKGNKTAIILEMILLMSWAIILRLTGRNLSFIIRNKIAPYALMDSNLVIIRGGDNLADIYGTSAFLSHIYNMLLAIVMKKKIIILGTSIGPFKRTISKYIALFILKKVDHIVTRDSKSMSLLRDARLNVGKIHFIPDVAFDLPLELGKNYDSLFRDPKVEYVGMGTSAMIANQIGRDRYVSLMANICDKITGQFSSNIIFISHVLSGGFNDEDIAREILVKMKNKDSAFIVHEVNPLKMKYLISKLELLISPRMHPIIHAFSTGVPVIGIDYNDKTRELMRFFDKERWVTDLNHIDTLFEMIDAFFALRRNDESFYKIERISVIDRYVDLIKSIR